MEQQQQQQETKAKLPAGFFDYTLTYDGRVEDAAYLRVYKYEDELVFGMRFLMPEWDKFVDLVNRFDKRIKLKGAGKI